MVKASPSNAEPGTPDKEPVFTIDELLDKKRHDLDGCVIKVKGFIFFHEPSSELYPNESGFRELLKTPHLWVGADKKGSIAERTPRPHLRWVIIKATFKDKPSGMFDEYFGDLEEIEEVVETTQ